MNAKLVLMTTVALTLATGCATQRYGRLAGLSDAEAIELSCARVDAEIVRAQGFADEVAQREHGFNPGRLLTDISMGNGQERSEATRSAQERIAQLRDVRVALACGEQGV